MTTLSKQIATLTNDAQALLSKPDVMNVYNNDIPRLEADLARMEADLYSFKIVFYGVKNYYATMGFNNAAAVLPSKEELQLRPNDWLSVGDAILGWISYSADAPRIIVRSETNGYYWRFVGKDPVGVERQPLGTIPRTAKDPYFLAHTWIKIPDFNQVDPGDVNAQLDYAIAFEDAEINRLNIEIEYLKTLQFI